MLKYKNLDWNSIIKSWNIEPILDIPQNIYQDLYQFVHKADFNVISIAPATILQLLDYHNLLPKELVAQAILNEVYAVFVKKQYDKFMNDESFIDDILKKIRLIPNINKTQPIVKFSRPNTKLLPLQKRIGKKVFSFDLQSGVSCPHAKECKSTARKNTDGTLYIQDGKDCVYRCFSASQEVLYKATYNLRRNNYLALKNAKSVGPMVELISNALPLTAQVVRLHVGGDFFSERYFRAIIQVAKKHPHIIWYGYTKAIRYWMNNIDEIPMNLRLTASYGGTQDYLIRQYTLPYVKVVLSEQEARDKCLVIDHDDYYAYSNHPKFALLIHGTQPKNTKISTTMLKLRKEGKNGYRKIKQSRIKQPKIKKCPQIEKCPLVLGINDTQNAYMSTYQPYHKKYRWVVAIPKEGVHISCHTRKGAREVWKDLKAQYITNNP